MPQSHEPKNWLIQIYFVAATLIGLILVVIATVSLVGMGIKQALGVKPYPNMSAVPMSFTQQSGFDRDSLRADQQQKFDEMQKMYDAQQAQVAAYDNDDQQKKMEVATSLAMLIVGIPVFAIHAPRVFKKD